jgi:cytochrome c553
MTMKLVKFTFVTLLYVASTLAFAEVPAKARVCASCHGAEGISNNPLWPNLAGQKPGYLEVQLEAFRDGRRQNAQMDLFAKGLSDADIQSIAAYYSQLPAKAAANGDADLVAVGENLSAYCKSCHGMSGKPAAPVWPNLAGQQSAYLAKQLAAFKSGERASPHMQTVLARFGEKEFAALAAYYSQLEP